MQSGQRQIGAGRYLLEEVLAAGGMGVVWKGTDTRLRRPVAVKEVSLDRIPAALHAEFVKRAEREGRNAAALADHPNIVTIYDVVVENGAPWTVMQLVRGRSLASVLQDGPLSVERTGELAEQLFSALKFAHEAGIIHRDVKPLNIMVSDLDDSALLTDFGIAKSEDDTQLTQPNSVIGSASYMPPERHEGAPGSAASDLFSLGSTLFEMVEGYSPFGRSTRTATITAVLTSPLPEMKCAGPLAPLIRALTAKQPAHRPSMAEACEMLKEARAGSRPPDKPAPTAPGPGQEQTDKASEPESSDRRLALASVFR